MHFMFRKAFTLIEVLVVVAIIGLLVSILLPSLKRAREVSRTTVCKTNMDTIYKGHLYYGADHKQHFPDPDWWLWDGAGGSMKNHFPNLYGGGPRPADSSQWVRFGHIYKYVKSKEAYFCPQDDRKRQGTTTIGNGKTASGIFRGYKPIHSYVRMIHPHQFYAAYLGTAADEIKNGALPTLYRSDFINPEALPRTWTYSGKRLGARPSQLGLMYEEFQSYDDPATWAAKPPNLDNMLNDGYSGFIDGDMGLTWQDYISVWHMKRSHMLFFDGHLTLVDAVQFNKKADKCKYAEWIAAGGPKP